MDAAARSAVAWLLARGQRLCAACSHYAPEAEALPSGVRYCRLRAIWDWPGGGYDCPDHDDGESHDEKEQTTG